SDSSLPPSCPEPPARLLLIGHRPVERGDIAAIHRLALTEPRPSHLRHSDLPGRALIGGFEAVPGRLGDSHRVDRVVGSGQSLRSGGPMIVIFGFVYLVDDVCPL